MQHVWLQMRQYDPVVENQELDLVVAHKQAVLGFTSSLFFKTKVLYSLVLSIAGCPGLYQQSCLQDPGTLVLGIEHEKGIQGFTSSLVSKTQVL